ncbi:aspartate carbamoyltransferase catalytic subunit [Chitinivibrio alkaliphilus]|uniref:Aspartate carbamoyltransferase n=1 Tax=Chitinivibrio alkaliphilus ACht1 TaxID=1313304 RepID=U7D7X6_9BACT|nr:aspartate carbamoyltransferase catalytic subunit [Chitinivibrio alkaliphilus]ERP32043.1 aspartate carbamoyltransferase [Chitinivibrio alkaliphilus ACht1]
MPVSIKHLLGLKGVSHDDITTILDTADTFHEVLQREVKVVPPLRGKTVVNFFYENSTRTRLSFEMAEKRLSANPLNFSTSGSSVSKGETLKDTIQNIEAMKIDMIVVRHQSAGIPLFLTTCTDAVIINAGDGYNEHPTQALLDIMTIRQRLRRLEGLKVTIVGDILHSRVARSNIWGMKTLGMNVTLCAPSTLLPHDHDALGCPCTTDVNDALEDADVIMLLRPQLERQQRGLFPSVREYRSFFGIDAEKMKRAQKNALIMHPGPINRGVELASDVADSDNSLILDQVTNGVATRMAVLYLLGGGDNVQ